MNENNNNSSEAIGSDAVTPTIQQNSEYKWFIVYAYQQQKVHRLSNELNNKKYVDFVKRVVVPKSKTVSWDGSKKIEKEMLVMNNYIFLEAREEVFEHCQQIEMEADCKFKIWDWPEGAEEIKNIEAFGEKAEVYKGIKVGSCVSLPKHGVEKFMIEEINGDILRGKAWIMPGCAPVDLEVYIKDAKPSDEEWEDK